MRRALKFLVFGIAWLLVLPLILVTWLEALVSRSEQVFQFCAHLLAPAPGWPGAKLRGAFYTATLANCHWETHIGFGSIFTHRGATLAAHVSIGAYCVIGHADLGPHVMTGSRVSIPSGKRQHFGDQGGVVTETRYDTVSVGARCWVGEGAIVLADVGADSIVAAGAVVVKPIPQSCLVGGNPAQVLRSPP